MPEFKDLGTRTIKLLGETKGAYKFSEVDNRGVEIPYLSQVLGTIYLRKGLFGGKMPPEKIRVSLSEVTTTGSTSS